MHNHAQSASKPKKLAKPSAPKDVRSDLTRVSNSRDPNAAAEFPGEAFLRLPDVIALTGIKSSTIYDLIKDGKFPSPEKITLRASGWRARHIFSWLKSPLTWAPTPKSPLDA